MRPLAEVAHALALAVTLIGGGFLLAVLWFDLKFDVLAWSALLHGSELSEDAMQAIITYYRQATGTESSGLPLIMMMMALSVVAALVQTGRSQLPLMLRGAALLFLVAPIALAGGRVVPNARILATQTMDLQTQTDLAILILHDHLYCFSSITAFLLLQLWIAGRYSLQR